MKQIWSGVQIAFSALGGFCGWFLGGFDGFLYALIAFVVIDYIGYPSDWANTFGNNYYSHAQARELATFIEDGTWQLAEQSQPFMESDLKVTSFAEAQTSIQQLMADIRQDTQQED